MCRAKKSVKLKWNWHGVARNVNTLSRPFWSFPSFFTICKIPVKNKGKIKLFIYVKYLMTIYIMTQVTIIPPKSKYLSPSDRRSISLITVFDMPKVEATSSIFLRMPFSIDRWSRMLSMMVCPWLNKSSRPRFALRVASLCSKALSITENKLVRKSQIVSKNSIFRKIQFWILIEN